MAGRDDRGRGIKILAFAEGQEQMTSFYRDDIAHLPEMELVARQIWETSGLGPGDNQLAAGWVVKAHDAFYECRFAGAVFSYQGMYFPGSHGEIHIIVG